MDIFIVEIVEMLSFLYYLIIGYDNSGFGVGWYCEKVIEIYVLNCVLKLKK